jgi:uncharacterized protein (TIGR03083 family)
VTAVCHTWSHDAYAGVAAREIEQMAALTEGTDMAVPVPTCPDWTPADLVGHVGGVHRWATHMVSVLAPERVGPSSITLDRPDDPSQLPKWLGAFAPTLEATFLAADPDAPMWAWGSDKHARFWPRRMLHETAVHRVDAELALGRTRGVDAAVAVDGVDEFLDNLPHAAYFAPSVDELRGQGETLAFIATDTETAWAITLEPDRFTWTHDPAPRANVTLRTSASDLLLVMYGRAAPAPASVHGDQALLDRWRRLASI